MNKKIISFMVACFLMATMAVTAGAVELQAGFEGQAIVKKELELDKSGLEVDYSAQYYDVAVQIPVGSKVTITPKIGINTFRGEGIDVANSELKFDGGIGWNLGVDISIDAIYTEFVDVAIVGKYRYSRTDVDDIALGGLYINNPLEVIMTTHEYEIGVIASKNLNEIEALEGIIDFTVIPYVGVVYSDLRGAMKANLSIASLQQDFRAQENIGIRLGVTLEPITDLQCSIDIGLVDQTSIGGSITYKF